MPLRDQRHIAEQRLAQILVRVGDLNAAQWVKHPPILRLLCVIIIHIRYCPYYYNAKFIMM